MRRRRRRLRGREVMRVRVRLLLVGAVRRRAHVLGHVVLVCRVHGSLMTFALETQADGFRHGRVRLAVAPDGVGKNGRRKSGVAEGDGGSLPRRIVVVKPARREAGRCAWRGGRHCGGCSAQGWGGGMRGHGLLRRRVQLSNGDCPRGQDRRASHRDADEMGTEGQNVVGRVR